MPTLIFLRSLSHTLFLLHFLLPHCPLLCCEEGSVRPEWKLFRVGQSPMSEGSVHVVGRGIRACRHIEDPVEWGEKTQDRTGPIHDGQETLINSCTPSMFDYVYILFMRLFHHLIIRAVLWPYVYYRGYDSKYWDILRHWRQDDVLFHRSVFSVVTLAI